LEVSLETVGMERSPKVPSAPSKSRYILKAAKVNGSLLLAGQ